MMNENLKELMRESNYAAPEIAKRAQKLAELIVKECIVIARAAKVNSIQNDKRLEGWTEAAMFIGDNIQEYFGIDFGCENQECQVCGTTKNVKWFDEHQLYLCDEVDCIPF